MDTTYRSKQPEIRHFREPQIQPPKLALTVTSFYTLKKAFFIAKQSSCMATTFRKKN